MESNLNPIAGNNFQQRQENDEIVATAATIVVTDKDRVQLNPAGVAKSSKKISLVDSIEIPVGDVREGQLPPALEAELMKRATEHGRANKDSQGRMQ